MNKIFKINQILAKYKILKKIYKKPKNFAKTKCLK